MSLTTSTRRAVAPAADLSVDNIARMRRNFYADGQISEDEAVELLEMSDRFDELQPAFATFFVEAMTDFVVHQTEPRGYVDQELAEWLVAQLMRDQAITTHTELELLVRVMETADSVPDELELFTLDTIGEAVLNGDQQLLNGEHLQQGVVGSAEANLIRRVIYGTGGSNTIFVSRAEADFLFDLNDATVAAPVDPAWAALFRQGVTNHLMAGVTYEPLTKNERLARDSEASPNRGVGGFISRMFTSAPDFEGFNEDDADQDWTRREVDADAKRNRDAANITRDEAEWLIERITRDGVLHDNEIAVLKFIKAEAPEICETLDELLADLGA